MPKAKKLPPKLIHEFADLAHSDKNIPQLTAKLEAHPELLNMPRPGNDKETAMGAAVHSKAMKVIDFLLERGVQMDVFTACVLEKYEIVEHFLNQNPKLLTGRAVHAHNMDLVDLAPSEKMVALLLKRGYPITIHVAAAKGLMGEIERILKQNPAQLHALDREGLQPLHLAIIGGHDDVAAYLIKRGADVKYVGANCRPMTYACNWGRDKVLGLLLEKDDDINFISTGYQLTYLQCAVRWPMGGAQAKHRIVRMLFKAGIDPAIRNKDGLTAYDMVVEIGAEAKDMADCIKELSSVRTRR